MSMMAEMDSPGKKLKYAPKPYASSTLPVESAMLPKDTRVIVNAPAVPSGRAGRGRARQEGRLTKKRRQRKERAQSRRVSRKARSGEGRRGGGREASRERESGNLFREDAGLAYPSRRPSPRGIADSADLPMYP